MSRTDGSAPIERRARSRVGCLDQYGTDKALALDRVLNRLRARRHPGAGTRAAAAAPARDRRPDGACMAWIRQETEDRPARHRALVEDVAEAVRPDRAARTGTIGAVTGGQFCCRGARKRGTGPPTLASRRKQVAATAVRRPCLRRCARFIAATAAPQAEDSPDAVADVPAEPPAVVVSVAARQPTAAARTSDVAVIAVMP